MSTIKGYTLREIDYSISREEVRFISIYLKWYCNGKSIPFIQEKRFNFLNSTYGSNQWDFRTLPVALGVLENYRKLYTTTITSHPELAKDFIYEDTKLYETSTNFVDEAVLLAAKRNWNVVYKYNDSFFNEPIQEKEQVMKSKPKAKKKPAKTGPVGIPGTVRMLAVALAKKGKTEQQILDGVNATGLTGRSGKPYTLNATKWWMKRALDEKEITKEEFEVVYPPKYKKAVEMSTAEIKRSSGLRMVSDEWKGKVETEIKGLRNTIADLKTTILQLVQQAQDVPPMVAGLKKPDIIRRLPNGEMIGYKKSEG